MGKARLAAGEHNVKDAIATYERIYTLQTDPTDKVAVIDQEAVVYANEKMDGDADRRVSARDRAVPQRDERAHGVRRLPAGEER